MSARWTGRPADARTEHWLAAGSVCALGIAGGLYITLGEMIGGQWQWLGGAALALWLNLLAVAAGLALGGRLLAGQPPALRLAAAAGLGWGGLGLIMLGLGLAGWLAPEITWTLLLALSLLVLGFCREWRLLLLDLPTLWRHAAPDRLSRLGRTGVLLALLPAVCILTVPPVAYDAMTYHLALPQYYANTGSISALPWNHYSGFPQLIEMQFLAGLQLATPWFSQFIVFSLGGWLLMALWALARYRFLLPPAGAWLALLIAVTVPEIWDAFSLAMIDVPAALFLLLAITFLAGDSRHELTLAALFTALAAGCKYTLWFALPLHALLALRRGLTPAHNLRRAAGFVGVALLLLAPWPLKNYVLTGNPVHPFAGEWFPTPGHEPDLRAAYARQGFQLFGTVNNLQNIIARPWDMTMQEEKFGVGTFATLGPLLLILVPFACGTGLPRGWALAGYAAAWYGWWSVTSQQHRHIVFLFCLLAIAAAAGARQVWRVRWCRPLLLAVLLAALAHNLTWSAMKKERFYSAWSWAAGALTENEYLTRHYPGWAVIEPVNILPEAGGTVLFVGHEFGAYLERPAIVAPAYNRDPLERLLLGLDPLAERNPAGLAAALRARGFNYLVWSELGYNFKRGFGHYRLDDERQQLLDGLRGLLIPLKTSDGVTLYALPDGLPADSPRPCVTP